MIPYVLGKAVYDLLSGAAYRIKRYA